jgi:hypothetical protein
MKRDYQLTDGMVVAWRMLTRIVDAGLDPRATEIARRSGIPQGTIGFYVQTLVRQGMVERRDRHLVLLHDMPPPEPGAPPPEMPAIAETRAEPAKRQHAQSPRRSERQSPMPRRRPERVPMREGARVETVEEFLARGGRITRLDPVDLGLIQITAMPARRNVKSS